MITQTVWSGKKKIIIYEFTELAHKKTQNSRPNFDKV